MPHDFTRFPELTNNQMQIYYFESPHKQIMEDFKAEVKRVIDGDTIEVRTNFRNFDFPIRIINIAAPERKEEGGAESKDWLEKQILGEEVDIFINKNLRVEKWGRLLGEVFFNGMNIGEDSIRNGHSIEWKQRGEKKIGDFNKQLDEREKQWF